MSAGFKACVFKPEVFENIDNVIENVSKNKYDFPDNMQITTNKNFKKLNL